MEILGMSENFLAVATPAYLFVGGILSVIFDREGEWGPGPTLTMMVGWPLFVFMLVGGAIHLFWVDRFKN